MLAQRRRVAALTEQSVQGEGCRGGQAVFRARAGARLLSRDSAEAASDAVNRDENPTWAAFLATESDIQGTSFQGRGFNKTQNPKKESGVR